MFQIPTETKMPMEPMDAMWMTRPPTVADAFGSSNVVFKSAVKNNNNNERKMTIAAGETPKLIAAQEPSSPVAVTRTRHFSISETFGSPLMNAFSQWAASPRGRSVSVCEENLKDILAKKTDN